MTDSCPWASRTFVLLMALVFAGCSWFGHKSPPPPPVKPSDYLYQTGKGDGVVVFVHGLWGDADTTWLNDATKAYWPTLIKNDDQLGKVDDVFLARYPTLKFGRSSNIEVVAQNLLQEMKDRGVFSKHQRIYFITHSMGGLVTKRLLRQLYTPDEVTTLRKVHAVVFLSTPALGAPVADLAKWISLNPQVKDLEAAEFNTFLQGLENDWQALLRERDRRHEFFPQAFCAYETLPTRGIQIVNYVYAASRCDNVPYGMAVDHFAMAKPVDAETDPYRWTKARLFEADELPLAASALVTTPSLRARARTVSTGPVADPKLWGVAGDILWKEASEKQDPKPANAALDAYRTAAKLDPTSAVYPAKIGGSLITLGKYQEAVPSLKKAVELDPTVAWYHSDLCESLIKIGQTQEAMASCRTAVLLEPSNSEAQVRLQKVIMKPER